MTIQVTGKNIEVGHALQTYLTDRTRNVLEKYIGPEIFGHVRISKEHGCFRTDCSIRLQTGLLLEAHGEAGDAYASADAALERLDKRVRRYKRRLKDHYVSSRRDDAAQAHGFALDYTVQPTEEPEESAENEEFSSDPLIIAEMKRPILSFNVSEAVMQLDLTEDIFLVFRNAANGSTNVVYRRSDGNIGWIDPSNTGI